MIKAKLRFLISLPLSHTYLRVKVHRNEVGFGVTCHQRLVEGELALVVHVFGPLLVNLFLETVEEIEKGGFSKTRNISNSVRLNNH